VTVANRRQRQTADTGGHVLIVVQNLPVPLDRRVWLECQALRDHGYHVSVICPKGPGDPSFQVLDSVRIHKYAPAPQANGAFRYAVEFLYSWIRTAWLALRVQRRDPIDVMQACNPPDTFWLLARLLRPFGVRFVYDQHDLCPELYRSRFDDEGSTFLEKGLLWLERMTYRTADRVVVTNESYRGIALRRGGVPASALTIVRSGPDPATMRAGEPRPELRKRRSHLLCYLGVMGPQDGVDRLVRAISVLVHELGVTDVQVAILGFGDCEEELRALTTELGLDEWITFTGRADAAMITEYLSTASIGLGPDPKSPLNDLSTMNKTMEYMAFSLPVVSFDLAETRFSAGEASLYVDNDDVREFACSIARLLADPGQRARMGAFGRQRVEQVLAWAHQVPGYVGVFDELVPVSASESRS
jgi:glycosyltransferase involved in cell wall biosynthesis